MRLKMDPPKKVPPGPFSPVENGPPSQLFAVANGPPLGKLGILQTLSLVHFHYAKWTPRSIFAVENGSPVHFHPLKLDYRFTFRRGKWTPRRKVDRGVPFSTGENGPGVHFQRRKVVRGGPFSTGGNGPGVHFQRRKMDRGGSILHRGVHCQRVKMDWESIFNGGPFSISHRRATSNDTNASPCTP